MKKAQSIGKNKGGFATLEILIAFAVVILSMGAVIMVSFGNQSVVVDSQTNNEAISKAQTFLEEARADSREDFLSVETIPATVDDIIYTKSLEVLDISECKKQATSIVSWNLETRVLTTTFSTFLSDVAGALMMGGDCDSESPGDWDNPTTAWITGIGGQGATDIDARNNFVYLTSSPSAPPKEDFFIYEFDPILISLTERGKVNVSGGLNNVDAIDNYAFTVNNDTSSHLMVFNVTDPSNPVLVATGSLPGMTTGIGRSIFFYNDFLYIGTQYLACPLCLPEQNNEFHIFDVSNPTIPTWQGSFKVNHNINDIVVRGDYAYLATSDNGGEVHVYDISDPTDIDFEGLFDAPGNEDGESLYLLGNKLYLGRDRTPAARKDFYILNISNPSNPTELGSKNLGLNPGPSVRVVGMVVRGKLAFVSMDDPNIGLKILNVSNPSIITDYTSCSTVNFSENSTAMDMDNNSIFISNQSNNEIRVIRDQASSC